MENIIIVKLKIDTNIIKCEYFEEAGPPLNNVTNNVHRTCSL